VRHGIAALHEEFERVVETRRVRLALVGNRPELGNILAEQVGGDGRLPRRHPVHIAAQRVDLAVMRDHAIGMRQRPGRERVGREALMHQRQRRLEARIAQILEIIAELGRQQHALVDSRPRRQRHGIEALRARVLELIDGIRDDLTQDEQLALEFVLARHVGALADEDLAMRRLGRDDALAEAGIVDRHVAPAEESLALCHDHALDDRLDELAPFWIHRQEQAADGVFARRRQAEAVLPRFLGKETVRNLHQHAAAVARLRVGADRAAMIEIEQDVQSHLDDLVRLLVVHVGDETDAAGVVFVLRAIEALRFRQAVIEDDRIGHWRNSLRRGNGGIESAGAFRRRVPRPDFAPFIA
jgi:hypothetical protein